MTKNFNIEEMKDGVHDARRVEVVVWLRGRRRPDLGGVPPVQSGRLERTAAALTLSAQEP